MLTANRYTVESFEYPQGGELRRSAWEAILPSAAGSAAAVASQKAPAPNVEQPAARAALTEEETRRIFDAGRQKGIELGRKAERESMVQAQEQQAAQIAASLTQFAEERQRYFSAVEQQVVELALGIAARILRREVQMDPLLLTGAVRVALGQLSASTQARLRVPAQDLPLWTETLAHLPNLALRPELVADAQMSTGECALETELGSVDLGLRAQLTEIERGFFDRAPAQRAAQESAFVQPAETRGARA